MVINAEDVPEYNIRQHVLPAAAFYPRGARQGEQILVHCHAGISRSSTIVLLHLMINRGLPLNKALAYLKKMRPQVQPNSGFMRYLVAVDDKLRGEYRRGHWLGQTRPDRRPRGQHQSCPRY